MKTKFLLILFYLTIVSATSDCFKAERPPFSVKSTQGLAVSAIKLLMSASTIAAPTINYMNSPFTFTKNVPIQAISPAVTGSITSCSISPSLPAGLSINSTDCVLSGTPTALQSNTTYTVTASGKDGSASATISISVNPKVVPASLSAGLYAWYPLDGNTDDLSGNANHGYSPGGIWPATSGPVYISGRKGVANDAASFNGTDQFFASNFAPRCEQDFTIAMWVYPVSVANNGILGTQVSPGSDPGAAIKIDAAGKVQFIAYWIASGFNTDGISGSSTNALSPNTWTHIAYVHDGVSRQGNIWVNGVSGGTTANFGAFAGCTTGTGSNMWHMGTPMNIGYSYNQTYYNGSMDDIWFFQNRKLTAGEIATLMGLP